MKSFLLMLVLAFSAPLFADTVHLTTKNTVVFRNEVSGSSVSEVSEKLREAVKVRGAAKYTIYLVLDSPGGSIEDGLSFIEYAKTIPNLKTISLFAASMASAIVQHLPGERLITSTGTHMYHRARGQIGGQFEDGELEVRLAYFKLIVRQMEEVNSQRMSMSLKDYKAAVVNEMWLYGKQAVEKKSADRVVDITCSEALSNQKTVERIDMFFFTIDVEYSGCPLFRNGKVIDPKKGLI